MKPQLVLSTMSVNNGLFLLLTLTAVGSSPAKILVVSFDGFRHDYVTELTTPHMSALRRKASWADHMVNVFPTKTFPNHHSIATGVYVETHGVLGSHIYQDPDHILEYSQEMFQYNENITPIWILNESKGRFSGSMMWLGGEFLYQKTKATFTRVLDKAAPWEEKVTTIVEWFQHPETPANLVMAYFHQPDYASHRFGTKSKQVSDQIKKVDDIVSYLDAKLLAANLSDVNVFLLSDHGMLDVPYKNILDVTPEQNVLLQPIRELYKTVGGSPVKQVVPVPGNEADVHSAFVKLAAENGHFKVYLKDSLPSSWHVCNTSRMSAVLLVADPGYGFEDLLEFGPTADTRLGLHGYDNSVAAMHPFFMAWGPRIRADQRVPAFDNVDLYSLWCRMLELNDTQSSGRFSNVRIMLEGCSSAERLTGLDLTVTVAHLLVGIKIWL